MAATVEFITFDLTAHEDAAKFSPRASLVVEHLISKGVDPADIDVMTAGQSAYCTGNENTDEEGWFHTGEEKRWGIGRTVNDRPYKFAHTIYARVLFIQATGPNDEDIVVELTQVRYGQGGKVRPQAMRVGTGVWPHDVFGGVTEGGKWAREAKAAFGTMAR